MVAGNEQQVAELPDGPLGDDAVPRLEAAGLVLGLAERDPPRVRAGQRRGRVRVHAQVLAAEHALRRVAGARSLRRP